MDDGTEMNSSEICLGDVPDSGEASSPWWENSIDCQGVVLDGTGDSEQACVDAGRCQYNSAMSDAGTLVESCLPAPTVVSDWCGEGYTGPMCSNCAEGYARAGITRFEPCLSCADSFPLAGWFICLGISGAILIWLEHSMLGPFHAIRAEDSGRAPLGVALIIGNGEYERWPSLPACHSDGIAMSHALEEMGYTVILVENGTQAELKEAVDRFR